VPTTEPPLIFPIGQFGGATGDPEDPLTRFPLRVGERVFEVDSETFTTWVCAHGVLDETSRGWTADQLLATMRGRGLDGRAPLARLAADGLVALVGPADLREFARRYRVEPLLLGLGEGDGDTLLLGLPGDPVLSVSGPLFAVWAWAALEPDLWAACERLVEDAREGGPPDLTEPETVLRGLLDGLPALLAAGAAYVDEARR